MIKCLVIAPYKGFKDLCIEISKTFSFDIHVEIGNFKSALALAKSAEKSGYDVIISRGGTARLIQEHCQIPVIEVKVTHFDILRMLTLLKGYTGKIGIVGSENLVHGVQQMAELLNMEMFHYAFKNAQEVETAIQQASREGIELIIGDVISVSYAQSLGLQVVLITSGREAITEALENVARMTRFSQWKQHKQLVQVGNHEKHPLFDFSFTHLSTTLLVPADTLITAKKWSIDSQPIFLCGERGTGKSRLASAIHLESAYCKGPFIIVDSLHKQVHNSLSWMGQASGGTLYLSNIEQLPIEEQKTLYQTLLSQAVNDQISFRLIVSSSVSINELKDLVYRPLLQILLPRKIMIPPLRERLGELGDIIRWIMVETNESMGTQVVGIRDDALEWLKGFKWPGNMDELRVNLLEMVQESHTLFVSLETAKHVLKRKSTKEIHTRTLLTKGTLEEFERDFIQMVLEEEDFNQSKAAKRLGIDRTTLWRKLKSR